MQLLTDVAERKDVPFAGIIADAANRYENAPSEIVILSVENGRGIHIHDEYCGYDPAVRSSCLRHLDDSDWVVTLSYICHGVGHRHVSFLTRAFTIPPEECMSPDGTHQAVYGVLNGTFTLWAD